MIKPIEPISKIQNEIENNNPNQNGKRESKSKNKNINYPSPKGKGLVKAQIDQPKCFGHYVNLLIRTIKCDCGYIADRDTNAALNIKKEGLRLLST